METYPATSAPTSEAAAESANPQVATAIRESVFLAIKAAGENGLTDEQMQEQLGLASNTQRPRRWELSHKGRIRQSGTRETKTGWQATVWVANEVPVPMENKATQPKQVTVTRLRNGNPAREIKKKERPTYKVVIHTEDHSTWGRTFLDLPDNALVIEAILLDRQYRLATLDKGDTRSRNITKATHEHWITLVRNHGLPGVNETQKCSYAGVLVGKIELRKADMVIEEIADD